jgi:serine/threonine protein kinase
VRITWKNAKLNEWDKKHGCEWVLKVFKKGTWLRQLKSQWPQGMLQHKVEELENWESPTPKRIRMYICNVYLGTLLWDGRFAFVMVKESIDLRSLIDGIMARTVGERGTPFSKEEGEEIMFDIAIGMGWLLSRNIVHRDLKASNVLVKATDGHFSCYVADYECSIGVIGTGFFRAPEILEACKDRSVGKREELFTKASDVYSYGMTCYEVLTGRLPFHDHDHHPQNDYDLVINGGHPMVPDYVDDWVHGLLNKCWQSNPGARPSFDDILNLILANLANNSSRFSKEDFDRIDWVKWKV